MNTAAAATEQATMIVCLLLLLVGGAGAGAAASVLLMMPVLSVVEALVSITVLEVLVFVARLVRLVAFMPAAISLSMFGTSTASMV
jgi:hypothetical protein